MFDQYIFLRTYKAIGLLISIKPLYSSFWNKPRSSVTYLSRF